MLTNVWRYEFAFFMFWKLEGEILEVILLLYPFPVVQICCPADARWFTSFLKFWWWNYCGKQTAWYCRVHSWREGLDICFLAQAEGLFVKMQSNVIFNDMINVELWPTSFHCRLFCWSVWKSRSPQQRCSGFGLGKSSFVGFINTFLCKFMCLCF